MSVPTPPRLTGNPSADTGGIVKYLGDLYRALVGEAQLVARADRLAAVDITGISNPGPDGKVLSRTPIVLPPFTDPPTADEMEALRQQVDNLAAVALKIVQAEQLQ